VPPVRSPAPPDLEHRSRVRGIVAAALLAVVLATLTVQVCTSHSPVLSLDAAVHRVVLRLPSGIVRIATVVTDAASPQLLIPVAAAICLGFAYVTRSLVWAALSLSTLAAVTVAVLVFKAAVGRISPDVSVGTESGAFPSGHAATVVVCLGLLLLARQGLGYRRLAVIGGAVLVAVVNVALVAGDFHWLSDVVAGDCLGGLLLLGANAGSSRYRPAPPRADADSSGVLSR
jgi:membrane-associated phospholipid phosphatase